MAESAQSKYDIAEQEDLRSTVVQNAFERVNKHIGDRAAALVDLPTTSTPELISQALEACPQALPETGLGTEATVSLLLDRICPALAGGQAGPRWFGLVTGGVLPISQLADNLVTAYDPVVQVHNPEETISTSLEAVTLRYIMQLLSINTGDFTANVFTTGATASNLLGLAVGRGATVNQIQRRRGKEDWDVGQDGMGGIEVEAFVAAAHASITKSASIVGLGRKAVIDMVDQHSDMPCDFNIPALEERLRKNYREGRGSIVVLSAGEVNTGGWTSGAQYIRELCDETAAWLHIDAAFGAFAVLHDDFKHLSKDFTLADSITLDCHKWLNAPYDCGVFLSREGQSGLYDVCGPGVKAPAYLAALPESEPGAYPAIDQYRDLHSPLFMNIENSRRFRALPVYSSLVALGRSGIAAMVQRNITFARRVIRFLNQHPAYDVLTPDNTDFIEMNIVIFAPSLKAPRRFRGNKGANELCKALNATRQIYTTPSTWRERRAVRIAVSNWLTGDKELGILKEVLEQVMIE